MKGETVYGGEKKVKSKELDNTISELCKWIQTGLQETGAFEKESILPEMTKALAALVAAKAFSDLC